jgi:hypothetical protein
VWDFVKKVEFLNGSSQKMLLLTFFISPFAS